MAASSLEYKHTKESIAIMSQIKKGIPITDTHKDNISISKGISIYVYSFDGFILINTFISARKAVEHFNVHHQLILRHTKVKNYLKDNGFYL